MARASCAASAASTVRSTGANRMGRWSSSRASISRSSTRPPIRVASPSIRVIALGDVRGLAHRALAVQLGIAPHGGQRGAQLVGGVRDELPHPLLRGLAGGEGLLDLGEHHVERPRQRGDLVLGGAGRDPSPEVAVRDGGGGVLDLAQRAEGALHGIPTADGARHEDGEADQQLDEDEAAHGVADAGEGHRDDEGRGVVLQASGHRAPVPGPVLGADGEGLGGVDARVVERQLVRDAGTGAGSGRVDLDRGGCRPSGRRRRRSRWAAGCASEPATC